MDKVNLKRLAKELNLSVSTVSRALSDSYEISLETKEKVRALAQKLNYQPNPYAKSLRKQESSTIAVIIPEIANSFFSLAINGIEEVAQEKGYHVLIYLTHENQLREEAIIRHLLNGRVDGILMSMATQTSAVNHLFELKEKNIPIVFFDRICDQINTVKVVTDDFESGFKATQHLINQGCKKIAYLSVSPNLSIDQKRVNGYLKCIHAHQMEDQVVYCGNNDEQNLSTIKTLFGSTERPDGVFASVEKLALSTYAACEELSLLIPADVKVVSFSNLPTAPLLNPSLTTITQPAYQIGKEAATSLFGALGRNPIELKEREIVVPSTLILRKSTG